MFSYFETKQRIKEQHHFLRVNRWNKVENIAEKLCVYYSTTEIEENHTFLSIVVGLLNIWFPHSQQIYWMEIACTLWLKKRGSKTWEKKEANFHCKTIENFFGSVLSPRTYPPSPNSNNKKPLTNNIIIFLPKIYVVFVSYVYIYWYESITKGEKLRDYTVGNVRIQYHNFYFHHFDGINFFFLIKMYLFHI